jgi:glyoxylase-like metal-dependent hydrolase (beta-lactamase superfamily II)
MTHSRLRAIIPAAALLLGACHRQAAQSAAPAAAPLQVATYVAPDSMNYHVVSTIVYGPTEALLVDGQNSMADGRAVAEQIAATGRHLKAIFITHPDHDHYTGLSAIVARFPGTPVYMAPAALAEYNRGAEQRTRQLAMWKQRMPATAPDSFVTPVALPAGNLSIDGEEFEVAKDRQGDVLTPSNSFVFIPSLNTMIAGDVVFNGIHPWLAASNAESRAQWRAALDQMASVHPRVVIAGHIATNATPNSPDAIAWTRDYLTAWDAERARATSADQLIAAMKQRYPAAEIPVLLVFSARSEFRTAP